MQVSVSVSVSTRNQQSQSQSRLLRLSGLSLSLESRTDKDLVSVSVSIPKILVSSAAEIYHEGKDPYSVLLVDCFTFQIQTEIQISALVISADIRISACRQLIEVYYGSF